MIREIYLELKTKEKRQLLSFLKTKTGLQETAVRAWCLGKRNPGIDRQTLIANFLGKDVKVLFPETETESC